MMHSRAAEHMRRLALARELVLAFLAGQSRREIADALGITEKRVSRLAKRCGVRFPQGFEPRTVGAKVHKRQLAKLDLLASNAGCSRGDMASRLISAALDAGPARLLGRDALPKRTRKAA